MYIFRIEIQRSDSCVAPHGYAGGHIFSQNLKEHILRTNLNVMSNSISLMLENEWLPSKRVAAGGIIMLTLILGDISACTYAFACVLRFSRENDVYVSIIIVYVLYDVFP